MSVTWMNSWQMPHWQMLISPLVSLSLSANKEDSNRADGSRKGKESNYIIGTRGYCCQEPFLVVESRGTGGEEEADGTEGWIDYSQAV
jgi:hypothetical protein